MVFSDYVLGKSVDYPIVTMASAEYVLRVGDNQALHAPTQHDKTATAGLAALEQLWDRARSTSDNIRFGDRRLSRAPPNSTTKYRPMAQVNRALANIELEQYEEAARILDAVVKSDPAKHEGSFSRREFS